MYFIVILSAATVAHAELNRACPELWHFDAAEETCRPNRENVNLICDADLITIELDNILLRTYSDITVNSCTNGVHVSQKEKVTQIFISTEVCDAEVTFEDDQIVLRNVVQMSYGKEDLSIPFDCVYLSTEGQMVDSTRQASRRSRRALAEASAHFDIKLDYYDAVFDSTLPPSRRLIVGEDAFVMVGIEQKIRGIEMAVTNCTVYDEEKTQSYSVIDYPRCPDNIVNAHLHSAPSQWENRLSYRVFEFVNDDMSTTLLKLVCRVILCDANLETSECKKTCDTTGRSSSATSARMHSQTVQKN